jgi:hypothetical protein
MATRIGVAREGRFSSWKPREIYESLDYLYIVTRLDSPQTMLIPPDLVPEGGRPRGGATTGQSMSADRRARIRILRPSFLGESSGGHLDPGRARHNRRPLLFSGSRS